MNGLPGTGKTTTAIKIRDALDIKILNPSMFRTERPLSLVESQIVDKEWYTSTEKYIKTRKSVIMDATFHTRKKREKLYRFGNRLNCNLIFIHCICNPQTAIARLRHQEFLKEKVFYYDISEMVSAYANTYEPVLKDHQNPPIIEYNTKIQKLKIYNPPSKSELFNQIIKILLK